MLPHQVRELNAEASKFRKLSGKQNEDALKQVLAFLSECIDKGIKAVEGKTKKHDQEVLETRKEGLAPPEAYDAAYQKTRQLNTQLRELQQEKTKVEKELEVLMLPAHLKPENLAFTESTFCQEIFLCPIGHQAMLDPVINDAGQTYERANIKEWFKTSNKDPLSNEVLPSVTLIPNVFCKQAIEKARDEFKAESKPTPMDS
jgi:hypothetical protein